MKAWTETTGIDLYVGDYISHYKTYGRIRAIERVREIGHFTSAAHIGKLRVSVEQAADLFIADDEIVEVYR